MLEMMWCKENTLSLLVGMKTSTITLETNMVVSQKIGKLPQNPGITLLGIFPKDAQSYHKNTCSTAFIAALFAIARTGNNLDGPQLKSE